ncbi:MAG: DUF3333 domain-containing protein, partial [Pseudomonadota bacterium]
MTDMPIESAPGRVPLTETDARTKKRNAAEKRFKLYGIGAILIGVAFLIVLAVAIIRSGVPAFTHTVMDVEFTVSQEEFDAAEGELFKTKAYSNLFIGKLAGQLEEKGLEIDIQEDAIERLLGKVGADIREFYRENPDALGSPHRFELSASSRVDGYFNGRVTRDTLVESRFLMLADLDLVDVLHEAGIIKGAFNWNFITGADSG